MDHRNAEVRQTQTLGQAVYAKGPIKAGEVIAEFDGPIYDVDSDDWNDDFENHAIQFAQDKWRDSQGIARYLNHSCEPNCGIKDLFKLVAMRDIAPGEELTWDYDMSEDNQEYSWQMHCQCGTASCRQVISGYRKLPHAVKERYAGFISTWLLQEDLSAK